MAIKNTQLGGTDWVGEKLLYPDLNDTFDAVVDLHTNLGVLGGKNTIRQLIDRAGVWSADLSDWWGDAYIDSNGRENSVNTGNTTARYTTSTDIYSAEENNVSSTTTHDPDSVTNPSNFFDENATTYAEKTITGVGTHVATYSLGKTFSSRSVGNLYIKASLTGTNTNSDGYIKLQTYNGSSWSDVATLDSGANDLSYDDNYALNATVQGVRIQIYGTSDYAGGGDTYYWWYELSIYDITETEVHHTIPSGTFSSTISTAIATTIVEDWETGADIKYKLTGTAGAEDTGWLNYNEITTFTAFTAEPDTFIIKLIPKTSSPTAGYPSINGAVVRGW